MNRLQWTSGKMLGLAALLLVLSNAYILSVAAINRADVSQSITLTERELSLPYQVFKNSENSGLNLKLQWAVKSECSQNDYPYGRRLTISNEDYEGFEFGVTGERLEREEKQGWVLLELNGPAYWQIVKNAENRLAKKELESNKVNDYELEKLERTKTKNTRLVAIDASNDSDRLQARMLILREKADEGVQYLLVPALVRKHYKDCETGGKGVNISKLLISSINLPAVYGVGIFREDKEYDDQRYVVELTFGKLGQPWIESFTLN